MKIFVEIYISTYTKSKEIRKNRTTLYDILDIKTRREHLYIQKFINHDTLCQELVLFSDKEIWSLKRNHLWLIICWQSRKYSSIIIIEQSKILIYDNFMRWEPIAQRDAFRPSYLLDMDLDKIKKRKEGVDDGCLRLSWSVSEATPPHTMAPRRPLPMGVASVQCFAGSENWTLRGRASSVSPPPPAQHSTSASIGGRTQTHSSPSPIRDRSETKS